ncbi:MAG: fumarylacetoacetate hydrolase family protein, partial [Cytophagales bacterium]
SKSKFETIKNLNFNLKVNGDQKQSGNTSLMIYSFEYILSYVSQFMTLKKGDIIFTGTPSGVGPIQIGDRLEAFLENEKMLDFEVK